MGELTIGPNLSPLDPSEGRFHHILDSELGLIGGYWLKPEKRRRLKGSTKFGFGLGPVPNLLPDAVDVRGQGRGTQAVAVCVTHIFREFNHIWVGFPIQEEYVPALRIVTKLGFTPYEHPLTFGQDVSAHVNLLGLHRKDWVAP